MLCIFGTQKIAKRFFIVSEHAQKHLSVNEDVPEIQQDFSAPPDAVTVATFHQSLTVHKLQSNLLH